MCLPITNLLSKIDGPVDWTDDSQKALDEVVAAIATSGLMLAKFGEPFIINSDFSY